MSKHHAAIGPGSGRGRPHSLPPPSTVTNRLVLQLALLKEDFHLTWPQVYDTAARVLDQDLSLLPRFKYVAAGALKGFGCAQNKKDFLELKLDFSFPKNSPFCEQYELTRHSLLYQDLLPIEQLKSGIPCGLVLELYNFMNAKSLNWHVFRSWLTVLSPGLPIPTAKALPGTLKGLKDKFKKIAPHKNSKNSTLKAKYTTFVDSIFFKPSDPPIASSGECLKL